MKKIKLMGSEETKISNSTDSEEPEEPDEPDELGQTEESNNSKKTQEKEKVRPLLEVFLQQAIKATKRKLNVYSMSGGRSIQGKSAEDFVQDAFVAYLGSKKILKIDVTDVAILKEIYNHIRSALQKVFGSREIRLVKNLSVEILEDPNPPEQRRLAEKEINRILAKLFDKFLSELTLNRRRAMEAIAGVNIQEMLLQILFLNQCKKVLHCLVKRRYLDTDYSRTKMSINLYRPAQLRKKLPNEYRALSSEIFHILKCDKFAKNKYLAGKLNISYRNAKILYHNLRNDFLDFLTKEIKNKNGILSEMSDADKIEIFSNWNKKLHENKNRYKR